MSPKLSNCQIPLAFAASFILLVALFACLPKYYKSSFIIARESEQAVELNRNITLNQPANYDLGLARTDNAVHEDGYAPIIRSDAFLYSLLNCPIHTLDNSWQGTIGEYFSHQNACQRLFSPLSEEGITCQPDDLWYSRQAVYAMRALRKAISIELNYESKQVTISCTAGDPLVATLIARAVNQQLLLTVDRYEMQKMERILHQIEEQALQAESRHNAPLAESLHRQAAVYQAQMIHHPAYLTLSEPSVDYRKAGPSLWKMPLLISLLLALACAAWRRRKQLLCLLIG